MLPISWNNTPWTFSRRKGKRSSTLLNSRALPPRATATRTARVGAFLQRRGLRELAARLDTDSYGGAVLLGLAGTVVIAHGASTARAVTSACLLAADLAAALVEERSRLGFLRAAEVTPAVRALSWGRDALFGVDRVDDLAAWPLAIAVPQAAAGAPAEAADLRK